MKRKEIEKLARWANSLNNGEWADDMPGKPDGWDEFPDIIYNHETFHPNKFDWSTSIVNRIVAIIGLEEFLRWHYIHNMKHTEKEFREWWKLQYEN